MAGVKGRSGGPRKNSGGARPGAGRKPKKAGKKSANNLKHGVRERLEEQPHGGALKRSASEPVPTDETDMLKHLQNIALGLTDASNVQVRAAIAAIQYTHTKKADGGKKDEQLEKARAIANKFAPAPPPLALVRK